MNRPEDTPLTWRECAIAAGMVILLTSGLVILGMIAVSFLLTP